MPQNPRQAESGYSARATRTQPSFGVKRKKPKQKVRK